MKFIIVALLVFSTSFLSYAEQTPIAKIDYMTVGDSYARIHLTEMMGVDNGVGNTCDDKGYYYLDLADNKNKEQFATILAAKATQSDIAFQVVAGACVGVYAEILHTYVY